MKTTLLACALALALPPAVHAQDAATSRTLSAFFDAQWERGLRESPESASYQGDRRFNDRWSDVSLAAIAQRESEDRDALKQLQAIDRSKLSAQDQLNYDIYRWQLEDTIAGERFKSYLRPVSQLGGVQSADGMSEVLQFATAKDYRDWLARMRAMPQLIDQNIALMREGMRSGNMPPKVLMERIPGQIGKQLVDDPAQSPFWRAFASFPDAIPAAERQQLQDEARKVITGEIVPAYRRFNTFFSNEYMPKTRASIAAADLPNGRAYYDYLAAHHTTTKLSAEQIHQIGLKEVARIRKEMEQIKDEVGFKGSLQEFFTDLRSNPKFFYKDPQTLLMAYRDTAKRIDPELVKIARIIPRTPYGVRPIPDNTAPDNTTAYYQGGALDGSRPGYYYVNLYRPEVRPKWEMMALSLHESVPGHHFQISRANELSGMPMFRRASGFTAYVEGWGLYAERLGYDMGLYSDPYDRMGQKAYDMWRAIRLVVDTGMHAKGWTRGQSIKFFMDNSPKTEADITNEIDRYISDPGQALAYKIGQMKISELRARAEHELGAKFDLRDYDDAVLETGSVPLEVMERHLNDWIEAKKRG